MKMLVVGALVGSLEILNAGASFAQAVAPRPVPGTPVPTLIVSPMSSQPVEVSPGAPSVPTAAPAEPAAPVAPAPPLVYIVPRDAPIVVRTKYSESSYSAKAGAKIRYIVTQDAIVDGQLIAKAGDTADGQVEEGQNGESGKLFGGGCKAANLRVSVDNVDRTESRRNQGAFGSNKDVRIGKGQQYVAVTDRPQRVCTEATSATPSPISGDALETNEQ